MYKIGEYVVHNGHGVCTIIEQTYNENLKMGFYKLESIYNKMTIMMPFDKADLFLRPILQKAELMKLINDAVAISGDYNKDNKERRNEFQVLVSSNNILDTMKLLKMIYHLAADKKTEKKTLGSFDTQFLQQAEKKLLNEVAMTMGITKDDANVLIHERLKTTSL